MRNARRQKRAAGFYGVPVRGVTAGRARVTVTYTDKTEHVVSSTRAGAFPVNAAVKARQLRKGRSNLSRATENGPAVCVYKQQVHSEVPALS